ncbi:MAG: small basic family protein [Chloroflexota bacterium]
MWLPLVGLLIGIVIGSVFSLQIPAQYSRYTAMAILAALDSLLGALRAELQGEYDNWIFVTGFFGNAILAAALTFLGDRMGVDLYLAAIVAFGVRLFQNLAIVRRILLEAWRGNRRQGDAATG